MIRWRRTERRTGLCGDAPRAPTQWPGPQGTSGRPGVSGPAATRTPPSGLAAKRNIQPSTHTTHSRFAPRRCTGHRDLTHIGYDGSNQIKHVTDVFLQPTTYAYDGAGKIGRIQDVAGRLTSFTVDASGRLTQEVSCSLCVSDMRYKRYMVLLFSDCFLYRCFHVPDRGAIAESSRGLERSENPRNRWAKAIASRRDARIDATNTASQTVTVISGIPSGCGPREGTVCRGSTLRFDPRLLSVTPSASSYNHGLMPEHSGRRTVTSVKGRLKKSILGLKIFKVASPCFWRCEPRFSRCFGGSPARTQSVQ